MATYGLIPQEANEYARKLLDALAPNHVLEPSTSKSFRPGTFTAVTVGFDGQHNNKFFEIIVAWLDDNMTTKVELKSVHAVASGVPNITLGVYDVTMSKLVGKQEMRRTFALNIENSDKSPIVAPRDINLLTPDGTIEGEFSRPATRALQIMERIQLGLKYKFES